MFGFIFSPPNIISIYLRISTQTTNYIMYTPFALCGNVSMPLQWTRILSMSVTGAGSFTPVPLVEQYFTSNVFIKAGSVQGFYITLNEVGEHDINSPRPPLIFHILLF